MNWIETYLNRGGLFHYLYPLFGEKATPIILVAFIVIVSYLLGSINFAIIISKRKYNEDIRTFGSKNAGATNMMRTYGKSAAALTFLGDAMKAVVATLIGYIVFAQLGAYIAGLFCIIGHMFPLFYHFRGGKGVVTAAMAILMCSPFVFLCVLAIFLCIAIGTKYVSLASVMSCFFYPILLYKCPKEWMGGAQTPYPLFAILIMLLIIYKHRENLVRLWRHEESKFSLHKTEKVVADQPIEEEEAEAPKLPPVKKKRKHKKKK